MADQKRAFIYVLAIQKYPQVLFLQNKQDMKWGPPGGLVDANENYMQAALREFKEETGVDFKYDENYFRTLISGPNYKNFIRTVTHPFILKKKKLQASEICNYTWCSEAAVEEFMKCGKLRPGSYDSTLVLLNKMRELGVRPGKRKRN